MAAMAGPPFLIPLCFLTLYLTHISLSFAVSQSHFEGIEPGAEDDSDDEVVPFSLHHPSVLTSPPPPLTQSEPESAHPEQFSLDSDSNPNPSLTSSSDHSKPSPNTFDFWDEDEFEGFPTTEEQQQQQVSSPLENPKITENETLVDDPSSDSPKRKRTKTSSSFTVEIVSGAFLIIFVINYFTGKRKNKKIALSWAAKFATKNSIFERNFSLLGAGEGDESLFLLKEEQNVFKFYAGGRRYCLGLVATMDLKRRHDLISQIYNLVVPSQDEINFEVYMNEEAMDHVIFSVVKKKAIKGVQKERKDLQRFAAMVSLPSGRKWVTDELAVISESREVAVDMIPESVHDEVFGDKAFGKFGKNFISMHFTDQHPGTQKKMLTFKFALPDADNMGNMFRLVALIPFYIDLIGHYKLSSQVRPKTEAARSKAAQEAYKEQQNTRHKRKAERRKMLEEAEAKLTAELLGKKEAARLKKKGMPKIKMNRTN